MFIYRDLKSELFNVMLYKSEFIIIPLKEHVGYSGQMLCLSAMQFGKPMIYSKNSTIHNYLKNSYGMSYKLNN